MARDVFLSYSVKDKVVADAIVARLEAESVTCWVAPRDVVPGADWGESIINAIESSRIMILIFSKSANESPQIKREVERAVNKEVYIIPFRVDDIAPAKKLEYFISTSQWMDAFAPPLERHLDNLAKTVKAVLASPPIPKPVGTDTPANRVGPTGPMATAQIPRPSSRKAILIAVAIAALMMVGGVGWYLGHKREAPYVPREAPYVPPAATPTVPSTPVATPSAAVTPVPIPVLTPTTPPPPPVAEPSIAPARGPWLFPDSSSRYLSATELSSLSSADLWRARNEIYARKGYKFSSPKGIVFARRLGNYYLGVDDDQDRVFNNMNQYEQANVTLIQSMEKGR